MIDQENKQQLQAYDLIANTNSSFFLTGRAGTGKTTFLRNVQKMVDKQFITLALILWTADGCLHARYDGQDERGKNPDADSYRHHYYR